MGEPMPPWRLYWTESPTPVPGLRHEPDEEVWVWAGSSEADRLRTFALAQDWPIDKAVRLVSGHGAGKRECHCTIRQIEAWDTGSGLLPQSRPAPGRRPSRSSSRTAFLQCLRASVDRAVDAGVLHHIDGTGILHLAQDALDRAHRRR